MKYKFFLQSGKFNGLLQVWNASNGGEDELTDTQEAQMQMDIETALNEHTALCAVAEAAEKQLAALMEIYRVAQVDNDAPQEFKNVESAANLELTDALSDLAAIRAEK